jgi:hypothetical protein
MTSFEVVDDFKGKGEGDAGSARGWKKITVRIEADLYLLLEDSAHRARVPLAVFCRELLRNRVPPPAPPLVNDVGPAASQLLNILRGMMPNLSQLEAHALVRGEPLVRLTGKAGFLSRLAARGHALGVKIKAGEIDETAAAQVLTRLSPAAEALNRVLALPINMGQSIPPYQWEEPLRVLGAALPTTEAVTPAVKVDRAP